MYYFKDKEGKCPVLVHIYLYIIYTIFGMKTSNKIIFFCIINNNLTKLVMLIINSQYKLLLVHFKTSFIYNSLISYKYNKYNYDKYL